MYIKSTKWDKVFSKYVRTRDLWTCQRCGSVHLPNSQGLHNSHFVGRGKYATRFDEDNCEALCYGCHRHLGSNPVLHKDHKVEKLGQERFDALMERSRQLTKRNKVLTKEFYVTLKQKLREINGKTNN